MTIGISRVACFAAFAAGVTGHDYIHLKTHQLSGQFGQPAYLSFVRSKLVTNALPFNVAKILHRFAKEPPEILHARGPDGQDADSWDPPLLGDADQRPKSNAARKSDKEIAPPHSIVSWAMV
jgi:hypothetical protein